MSDLISIIVPVYKVEKYLDRCIKSIVEQSYKNIEIILVDDGSPDTCPKMCDAWEKKDSRIVVYHKTNGGLSDARNYGLKRAKGDYILFIDSDDYIEQDTCEKFIVNVDDDVDLVCGAYKEIRATSTIVKRHSNLLENVSYNSKEFVVFSIRNNEWYAPAVLSLYNKKFLINNNLFFKTGILYEDVEYIIRVFLAANKVKYMDYAFYNYIIRENSITTSKVNQKNINSVIYIYSNWLDIIRGVDDKSYQTMLYGMLVKYYLSSCRKLNIKNWKIEGLDFSFSLKYALNVKEKLKVLFFNFFPELYLNITKFKKD